MPARHRAMAGAQRYPGGRQRCSLAGSRRTREAKRSLALIGIDTHRAPKQTDLQAKLHARMDGAGHRPRRTCERLERLLAAVAPAADEIGWHWGLLVAGYIWQQLTSVVGVIGATWNRAKTSEIEAPPSSWAAGWRSSQVRLHDRASTARINIRTHVNQCRSSMQAPTLACGPKEAAGAEQQVEGPVGCVDRRHTLEKSIYLAANIAGKQHLDHGPSRRQRWRSGPHSRFLKARER